MTLDQTLFMLREARALTMLEAVIRQSCEAPEWTSVLAAITDRKRWSTYLLSLETPEVIAVAQDMLNAEILTTAGADLSVPAPLFAGTVPGSARIH